PRVADRSSRTASDDERIPMWQVPPCRLRGPYPNRRRDVDRNGTLSNRFATRPTLRYAASRHSTSIEKEGTSAGGHGAAPGGAGLMCGIYGVVMRPGLEPDRVALGRMGRTLIHRGPDGDGTRVQGRAGLGCRRLAIIDVEHGAQPLANERGNVLVVCNGEIYNHRALRERLERAGHRFRTGSDAEVIPHLYEERGLDFVDELEGMFGLALWDSSAQRLVLARDRMGE